MSFRKALATLVLCVAAPAAMAQPPAVAAAQDQRRVEIAYEITFAGFSGFRFDFTGNFDGTRYDIESHAYKEGLLRAVTIHYAGRNRAWGTVTPSGAQPAGGSLAIIVSDKTRSWRAQYGPGGRLSETHQPDWKPEPSQAIPEDKRTGSLDPLSAGMVAIMAGEKVCDRTVPSNDGKRRIDIILRKVGSESPAAAGVPGALEDLQICEVHTKRIAGEFHDAPQEAESERERPMKLWFARMDSSPFRYPVKLEAKTGFGTIRGKLVYFREIMGAAK